MNISLVFPQYFHATYHPMSFLKQKSLCVLDPYRINKKTSGN